ncbi:MAG: hypothetical protein WDZ35_12120 [Crocinitomicaceae bacterium]
MNIKSTFILFLILSFFSCKKENHKRWTEVVVHARDELSGDKIEDIECYILYTDYDASLFGETVVVDHGFTVNGVYEFGFKGKKGVHYRLESSFDPAAYYPIDFSSYIDLVKGENHNFTFNFVPKAELRMKITNTNCFNDSDKIVVYRPNIDVPSYNAYPDDPNPIYGCYDDTSPFVNIPTGRYAFEWHVTKNSVTEIFYDTLHLQEGDKVTYEILY